MMSTSMGFSSELYLLDPQDLITLSDTTKQLSDISPDEVVILISPHTQDQLCSGRHLVEQAIADGTAYIPVRVLFESQISPWNLLAIFIKPLRQRYKYKNHQYYHTSLSKLRELKIERGFRNAENAYKISKRWHISDEERIRKYTSLSQSLEKGYNDQYPLQIMLCRRMGVKDCIDDGHHRIGICVEKKIDRITVSFRAAGALPRWLQKLLLPLL